MVSFDQTGAMRWMVPGNYQPQIATADGGLIATDPSGVAITFDQYGYATGVLAGSPTQSWTGSTYQLGSIKDVASAPTAVATPPYSSFAGANQSGNGTSPLCHDERDQLIAEYGKTIVLDSSYPKKPWPSFVTKASWPRFTPNCFELTNAAHSASFTFAQINNPGPKAGKPEFSWALIKFPLVVSASSGYGLDSWLQWYGSARTITSGYRDPVQNGGALASRHMLGDAVDFQDVSRTLQEFNDMNRAALQAGADFVESVNEWCGASLGCAHADWRYHNRNDYAFWWRCANEVCTY